MDNNELQHWGIKGMRWGHRRYQNTDGSLTPAGRERYSEDDMADAYKQGQKDTKREQKEARKQKIKTTLKIGATAAATALAVIGVKKYIESKQQPMWKDGKTPLEKFAKKEGISIMEALKRTRESNRAANTSSTNAFSGMKWNTRQATDAGKAAVSTALTVIGNTRYSAFSGTPTYDRSKTGIKLDDNTEFYQSSLNGQDELQHHGILGMKWGRRRYQNKDGSLTPAGRKRYGQDQLSPEERAEREAEVKKSVIGSGDITKVSAYRSKLTNEELRKALERVDLNNRIDSLDAQQRESGFNRVMSTLDKVDRTRGAVEKLVNTYNLAAKINNTFNKDKQIRTIDGQYKDVADEYIKSLLKSGTASDAVKSFGKLSANDLGEIDKRLRLEDSIRKRAEKENKQ